MNIGGKYKEHSHQTKQDIEDAQKRHFKDILQPRDANGDINIDFVREYGIKFITVSDIDIKIMEKKDRGMANWLRKNR